MKKNIKIIVVISLGLTLFTFASMINKNNSSSNIYKKINKEETKDAVEDITFEVSHFNDETEETSIDNIGMQDSVEKVKNENTNNLINNLPNQNANSN